MYGKIITKKTQKKVDITGKNNMFLYFFVIFY